MKINNMVVIGAMFIALVISMWTIFESRRQHQQIQNDYAGTELVNEGGELVWEILNFNRVRFSGKAACWNTKPEHMEYATCDRPENKISAGFYAISRAACASCSVLLTPVPSAFNSKNPDEAYRVEPNFYRQLQIDSIEGTTKFTVSVFYEHGMLPQPRRNLMSLPNIP